MLPFITAVAVGSLAPATDPPVATPDPDGDHRVLAAALLPAAALVAGAATIYGSITLGRGHTGESVAFGIGVGLIGIAPSLGRFAIGDDFGNAWFALRVGGFAAIALGFAVQEPDYEAQRIIRGPATGVLWFGGAAAVLLGSIGEIRSGVITAGRGRVQIQPAVTATTIGIAGCF